MTDRELMQQALDALGISVEGGTSAWSKKVNALKEALRARLAQPEQEPVAWELRKGKTDRVLLEITNNPQRARDWKASLEEVVPLYTAPPQRDETPAKAVEWKGLTDEQVKQIEMSASSTLSAIYLAEAQLKGKNT